MSPDAKTTSKATTEADTPAAVEEETATPSGKLSRERIFAESHLLFGYPRHVVAGALHGDDSDEFSRSEVASKIKSFLNRRVEG